MLRGVTAGREAVLAKTESPAEVDGTHHELGGAVPVIALIESALGVEAATNTARSEGSTRLRSGAATMVATLAPMPRT